MLIEKLKELNIEGEIYCDSAEPNRIQEINNAGFNAIPADKSVKDGIDFIKSKKLFIDEKSTNLISEIRGYSYKTKGDEVFG